MTQAHGNVTEDIGTSAPRLAMQKQIYSVVQYSTILECLPTELISQPEILTKVYMQNIVKEESRKQSCSLAHILAEIMVYKMLGCFIMYHLVPRF